LQQRGKAGVGANRRTAEYTGGGAAIGAIIGAIAGGGKGAAIGAGAGAGAGALTQVLTKGSAIRVPAETILMFKLDRALRVVKAQ
jgi:outer membrane lipoprotein SlyB